MVLELTTDTTQVLLNSGLTEEAAEVLAEADDPYGYALAAGALGVGLSALGAGIAEARIGSAAVGAVAEDRDMFGTGIIFTVLPETLVIFAIVVFILLL